MSQVILKEILHPQMDILFVALNPAEKSNGNGHYFSGSWSFWNLILNAGLITQSVQFPTTGDIEVFHKNKINYKNSIYGVTDLCHDIVQTNSSKVQVDAIRVQRILNILKNYTVKNLCLIHAKVGKAFAKNIPTLNRNQRYGLIGKINSTYVYEMPFHCASISDKHLSYNELLSVL